MLMVSRLVICASYFTSASKIPCRSQRGRAIYQMDRSLHVVLVLSVLYDLEVDWIKPTDCQHFALPGWIHGQADSCILGQTRSLDRSDPWEADFLYPRAQFTNNVKSIIMSLNFSSSQLARISLAEFVSKLILINLTWFVNRALDVQAEYLDRLNPWTGWIPGQAESLDRLNPWTGWIPGQAGSPYP